MDIGSLVPVGAPFATPEFLCELGAIAEECGFNSLWVGEHLIIPRDAVSEYPLAGDGKMPAAIQYGELDPHTTLTYLAGVTQGLRLGSCTIVPQRNPVYTAKEIANADWLSRGRIDFGVGVGWAAEEYDAVGAPFDKRGSRCRSYLRVMKECWENSVAEYEDEFYRLPPSLLYPKPIQKPHPPIHILGSSTASLKRVAELGNGFFPLDESPEEMARLLEKLDGYMDKEGRRREEIFVSVSPYTRDCDLDMIKRYRDAGVDQVVLFKFLQEYEEIRGTMEGFAERIVEPARSL